MPFPCQHRHMPSFSLVLTQFLEVEEPIEVVALGNSQQPSKQEFYIDFQPKDDDPLMKTVDTRFSGSSAYEVECSTYSKQGNAAKADVHVHEVTGPFSSSSSLCSTDDEDDGASTTELDLNREFEAEFGLVDADSDVDSFDGEMEDIDPVPPLHRQPAALASLTQAPRFPPPRYWEIELRDASGISICDVGGLAGPATPICVRNSEGEPTAFPTTPCPRQGGLKRLKSFLGIFKTLTPLRRRLRSASGRALRPTKNPCPVSSCHTTGEAECET